MTTNLDNVLQGWREIIAVQVPLERKICNGYPYSRVILDEMYPKRFSFSPSEEHSMKSYVRVESTPLYSSNHACNLHGAIIFNGTYGFVECFQC